MLASQLFRRFVQTGSLTIIDSAGRRATFGGNGKPASTIRIHDRRTHRRLLVEPDLAVGEAYMDGMLTIEEGTLYDFLDVCVSNLRHARPSGRLGLLEALQRIRGRLDAWNPIGKAQAKVAHHYDLNGELFDLFLDGDRQYSCAYFASPSDDIDTAQERKKRHLAAKLLLRPGLRVLDIGSGWGGLALSLAAAENVSVAGVTLSTEQHQVSNHRAEEHGLADRVAFHLRDYRQETGAYDRVVSVGMFEHVGKSHYREFFGALARLLTEDGVAVVHSVGRFDRPGPVNPWIRKYIFPGTYVPTLSEVLPVVEESGLLVTDVEILRLHYAETLRSWRRRFYANLDRVRAMYDDRFCRMWDFYLTSCELGFRRSELMVFQIQLAKSLDAVPLTRDYIVDWEAAHAPSRQSAAAE